MAAPRWLIVVMGLPLPGVMGRDVLRGGAAPADHVRGRGPDMVGSTGQARSESLVRILGPDREQRDGAAHTGMGARGPVHSARCGAVRQMGRTSCRAAAPAAYTVARWRPA